MLEQCIDKYNEWKLETSLRNKTTPLHFMFKDDETLLKQIKCTILGLAKPLLIYVPVNKTLLNFLIAPPWGWLRPYSSTLLYLRHFMSRS